MLPARLDASCSPRPSALNRLTSASRPMLFKSAFCPCSPAKVSRKVSSTVVRMASRVMPVPESSVGFALAFLLQSDDHLVLPYRTIALDCALPQALDFQGIAEPVQLRGLLKLHVDQRAAAEVDPVAGAALGQQADKPEEA